MESTRAPHFLRVVQALAFVSGVGPAATLAGGALLGCSSSSAQGVLACPEDASCGGGVASDGSFPFDGFVTGVVPIEAGAYDGHVVGVVANPDGGGGIQSPPGDASAEVGLVGGPLVAPELPA
jgi:hypothetical protein